LNSGNLIGRWSQLGSPRRPGSPLGGGGGVHLPGVSEELNLAEIVARCRRLLSDLDCIAGGSVFRSSPLQIRSFVLPMRSFTPSFGSFALSFHKIGRPSFAGREPSAPFPLKTPLVSLLLLPFHRLSLPFSSDCFHCLASYWSPLTYIPGVWRPIGHLYITYIPTVWHPIGHL
jgi:hypothetical protein